MRMFVGVGVPEGTAAALMADVASRRKNTEVAGAGLGTRARWTAAVDLHVTLAFLGEVEAGRELRVEAALRDVEAPVFAASVGSLGTFATAGVLVGVVDPSPALVALQHRVAEVLQGVGWPPEVRPFRPHITLARTRRPLSGTQAQQWTGEMDEVLRWEVAEFGLYATQSRRAECGVGRYDRRAVFSLARP